MRKNAHKKRVLQHDNAQEGGKCKNAQKCTTKKKAEKTHKAEQKRGLMTRYRRKGKALIFRAKLN